MPRGVNKRIIEVKGDGNDYFERAILIVRNERHSESESLLKAAGCDFLNLLYFPETKQRLKLKQILFGASLFLSAAAFGGVMIYLIK